VDNDVAEAAHLRLELVFISVSRKIFRHCQNFVVDVVEIPVRAAAWMLLRAKNVPRGEGARLGHTTSEKP
jgi:hypothetical protein